METYNVNLHPTTLRIMAWKVDHTCGLLWYRTSANLEYVPLQVEFLKWVRGVNPFDSDEIQQEVLKIENKKRYTKLFEEPLTASKYFYWYAKIKYV